MTSTLDHASIDEALRRAGSGWDAAQAHGLMAGRLAVAGAGGGSACVADLLEGTSPTDVRGKECEFLLVELLQSTHREFADRLSAFSPLLPDDSADCTERTTALAHWCEGYLHGLVSVKRPEPLSRRLAAEPLAGIVKDMLAITQAAVEEDTIDEAEEDAYIEVVEYVRVAAQLVYEELAELRSQSKE